MTEFSVALRDLLTRQELEVLKGMSEGLDNSAIASVLVVQPRTVEHHINTLFSKLQVTGKGVHRRVQAVLIYLRGDDPRVLGSRPHLQETLGILEAKLANNRRERSQLVETITSLKRLLEESGT
jgi:DNA-binding CsgD family transcriptional regulator